MVSQRKQTSKCIVGLSVQNGLWLEASNKTLLVSQEKYRSKHRQISRHTLMRCMNTDRQPNCQDVEGTDKTYKADEAGWRTTYQAHV